MPKLGRGFLLAFLLLIFVAAIFPLSASAAPTTSITVRKVASDGITILDEKTVTYQWLMDPDNIPVMGDGITHYFHQGPVFVDHPDEKTKEMLRWNPEETVNIEKDMGALKGTNVRDLCELVGGMSEGDKLNIKADDGLSKTFKYENVYEYSDREGPMVICWYKDGQFPDTGYKDGMRLVWFADASTNPSGMHVFGNWDWHEAAAEEYWYYFRTGDERYPTTTGLSVQTVSEITIRSTQAPEPIIEAPKVPVAAFGADATSGTVPFTVKFADGSSSSPTSWSWDFDNDGEEDSSSQDPSHTYEEVGVYSVRLIVANSAGQGEVVKEGYITVGPEPVSEAPPSAPSEGHEIVPQGGQEPEGQEMVPYDGEEPEESRRKFPLLTVGIAVVAVVAGIAACLGRIRSQHKMDS